MELRYRLALIGAAATSFSHAALVAHYTFDEGSGTTAADSAGGDQNASTNQGTVGWLSVGKIGGALDLPGNASMQAADAIGAGATAYTISVWVNMDDTPAYDGIYSARDTSPTQNENLGINVEGGSAANLHADFRYDNQGINASSSGIDSTNGTIATGNWVHLASTWISGGGGAIYLNGVNVGIQPTSTTTYDGHLTTWNIGDDPCCNGRELNAQVDDLAVWDEALTDAQITQIYNGGNAGLDAPTSLAVPEPSTSLLGAIASLALLRRRR